MKKKTILILLLTFSLINISGCHSNGNIGIDISNPPPNWRGVILGKTTMQEFRKIIDELESIKKDTIIEKGEYRLFQSEVRFDSISGTQIEAYFMDDKVVDLYFFNNLDINLKQAIELYGEPKFIVAFTAWCNPTPLLSFGDPECIQIHAFIPESGIEFGYQTSISNNLRIDGNAILTRIELFDPSLYDQLVESMAFFGFDQETFDKYTEPWTGIGGVLDH